MINIKMNSTNAGKMEKMSRNDFRISPVHKLNNLTTESVSRHAARTAAQNSEARRMSSQQPLQDRPQQRPPAVQSSQSPLQRSGIQTTTSQTKTQAPQSRVQPSGMQQSQARAQQPHQQTAATVTHRAKRPPLPPPAKILKKGEKYSLTKNSPSSLNLRIGIGWDYATNDEYDIDIEAFLLNDCEVVPDDSWIVFYGQMKSPDGAVVHRGDSSNGASFGADCEQIDVNLSAIDKRIFKIAFVVTINEAKQNHFNFSGIKNAHIRISDIRTGKEIIRYELTDYYREVISMVVGELYLRNGEWRFNPVGMGTGDDLEGLCNKYGIEVK